MPPKATAAASKKRRASTGGVELAADSSQSSVDAIARSRAIATISESDSKKRQKVGGTPPMSEDDEDEDDVSPSRGRAAKRGGGLAEVKDRERAAIEARTQAAITALKRSPSPAAAGRNVVPYPPTPTPVSAPRTPASTASRTPASTSRSPLGRTVPYPKVVIVNAGSAIRKSLSPVRQVQVQADPPYAGIAGGGGRIAPDHDRRSTIHAVPEYDHRRSSNSDRAIQSAKMNIAAAAAAAPTAAYFTSSPGGRDAAADIPVEIFVPVERLSARQQSRVAIQDEVVEGGDGDGVGTAAYTEGRDVFKVPEWAEHGDALAVAAVLLVAALALLLGGGGGDDSPSTSSGAPSRQTSEASGSGISLTFVFFSAIVCAGAFFVSGGWKYVMEPPAPSTPSPSQSQSQSQSGLPRRGDAQLPFTKDLGIRKSLSPVRPRVGVGLDPYPYPYPGSTIGSSASSSSSTATTPVSTKAAAAVDKSSSEASPGGGPESRFGWALNAQMSFFGLITTLLFAAYLLYPDIRTWYCVAGAAVLAGGYVAWWKYEAKKIRSNKITDLDRYVRDFLRFACDSKPYPHSYIFSDLKDRCHDKKWPADTPASIRALTERELQGLWLDALESVKQHSRVRVSVAEYHGQETEHLLYVGDTPFKKVGSR